MMKYENLEAILNLRISPETPAGLSERILHAARHVPQRRAGASSWASRLQAEWAEFWQVFGLPPRHALAFSVILALGLLLGFYEPLDQVLPGVTSAELAGFMKIDDHFAAGEWL